MIMKELQFLAGLFFDFDIPKDKAYLFRYFRTPLEKQFIRYYYCFGNFDYFTEHTGFYCQERWMKILKKRLDKLLLVHKQARQEMDLDLLTKIESGKHKKIINK